MATLISTRMASLITVQAIWSIFDTDGSGSIERGEFLRPNEGLADTILATLGQA